MNNIARWILMLMIVLMAGCDEDNNNGVEKKSDWGVSYVQKDQANNAIGTIDQQNNGPKVTHIVDSAYVMNVDDDQYRELTRHDVYKLVYKFETMDSLKLIISKATTDYNYHFSDDDDQNRLLYALFNNDTLMLKESAVSIQPRPKEVSFHTVTNVHTLDAGDFNGTVNGVPLVERLD